MTATPTGSANPGTAAPRPVPWRTILASIAAVVATVVLVLVVREVARILVWIVIAGFFAVVLSPPVDFLEHRLRFPRAVATLVGACLAATVFTLLPAIILGFAVKAAEREDRQREAGQPPG
jgi:predicted PurR-regulated permease PerM